MRGDASLAEAVVTARSCGPKVSCPIRCSILLFPAGRDACTIEIRSLLRSTLSPLYLFRRAIGQSGGSEDCGCPPAAYRPVAVQRAARCTAEPPGIACATASRIASISLRAAGDG